MKKVLLLFIFGLSVQSIMACEFCGCSSGNYFIGPYPEFHSYFMGVRYSFRSFNTSLLSNPGEFSRDFYQTTELWGGVNLGTRWRLLGFLPYAINRQNSDDGVTKTSGLGDLTLLVNYRLLKTSRQDGANHQLWFGGGVKLPTGKFAVDPDDLVSSANRQPGSGSLDYVVNTMYSFQFKRWGLNGNANYKVNQSAGSFRFGNRFAANAFVFRSLPVSSATLSPNLGFLYENLASSMHDGIKVESTDGNALLIAGGLETNVSRMAVGVNVQLPLSQHFSDGQTATKVRGMVHVTYTF